MPEWLEKLLDAMARSGWLLLRMLGQGVQQLYDDWMAISRRARIAYAGALLLGWFVSLAVMLGLDAIGLTLDAAGLQTIEERWLRSVIDWSPLEVVNLIPLGLFGSPFFVIPVVLTAAALAVYLRAPMHALSILASFFMVELILIASWELWNRNRPDFFYDGLFIESFNAFPSGHVLQAIPVYGFLTYIWMTRSNSVLEKGLAAVVLTAVIAVTILERLALGRHWPSDVVGALIVGFLWLAVVILAQRRGEAVAANVTH